ncbi:MAG: response regulator [Planctomycetota bacterium]|nr:MAG: response regulator [Planctomycetota bacterium]
MDAKQILLIAEGNDEHFLLTTRYIEQKGITNRIVRFTDGRTLLDFFVAINSFGLLPQTNYILLLDIDIPQVTGLEVLRQIRQSTRLRHMPVIMLITSADRSTIDHCYSLGCDACFTKPPHGNDLVDTLKNLGAALPKEPAGQTPSAT